jgi:hypothetical protein
MMDDLDRQAIKRGDCELIPPGRSDKDLRDEMNSRTHKSGLTNRCGECCRGTGKIMSHGFGESKLNVWPRDESGHLIE